MSRDVAFLRQKGLILIRPLLLAFNCTVIIGQTLWFSKPMFLFFLAPYSANALKIAIPTALADCGFCPVINLPSMVTWDCQGSDFS